MKYLAIALLVLTPSVPEIGQQAVYSGTWLTTNRQLDGTLTCVVTNLGDNQWRGHFSGTFQGSPFSYSVTFSGKPNQLRGKAIIDGAEYDWTGKIDKGPPGTFRGSFSGRYVGSFDLKEQRK